MACSSPPALSDRQLLEYLDGIADGHVRAHVALCPDCAERAAALGRSQAQLARWLFRAECPSSLDLGEYALGMASSSRAPVLREHLAICPKCSAELAQLTAYLKDLSHDLAASPRERLRVVVARLLGGVEGAGRGGGDPSPAFARLRGGADGPRIYTADELQVALEVHDDVERPGHRVVILLVTGPAEVLSLEAVVWRDDQEVARAAVDPAGYSMLSPLAPGTYDLTLRGGDIEVHIPNLQVD